MRRMVLLPSSLTRRLPSAGWVMPTGAAPDFALVEAQQPAGEEFFGFAGGLGNS